MASAKKTAVALATILTCMAVGTSAEIVQETPKKPASAANNSSQSGQTDTANPAQSAGMAIVNPIKKAKIQDADDSVEDLEDSTVFQNQYFQDALETLLSQPKQTGELEPKETTTEGPRHFMQTASELQDQIDQAQLEAQADSSTQEQTVSLAQIGSSQEAPKDGDAKKAKKGDEKESEEQQTKMDLIIGELTTYLGSKEKADAVVDSVLEDLNDTFDDGQILPVLHKQAQQLIKIKKDGKRVDAIVKKLADTVGNEEKARESVEKVFEALGKKYKQADIIAALESDVAAISEKTKKEKEAAKKAEEEAEEAEKADSAEETLNQVDSQTDADEENANATKKDKKAKQANVISPPKTKKEKSGANTSTTMIDENASKDATEQSSEPAITQDDILAEQKDLQFQSLPTPDQELAKMKKKLTPVAPEDKTVANTDALLKANFIKIAKRSKVWLLAMNEQQMMEPKEKGVERAHEFASSLIAKDYLKGIKQKYRAPHVMGDAEVEEFLEMLAEAIYESIGRDRTKVFQLDKIFPLYPPSRMHFDYTAMVTNGAFDSLLDDLANQKALSLAIRLVSEDIVKKLSAANGADYVDAGITVTDFVRKMFLDSGKSVEVGPLSTAILDSFERTVSERTEAVSEALLNKSNETTGRLMGMLMEQEAEIKAEFSLFNAFTNLNDDLTASIELISEHVALEESKVSSRFTRTLVNTDLYDVKRPIGTPSLIERYENDKFQQLWAELTEGAL